MSVQSNNQGRAYEYICLLTLNEEINNVREAKIIENSAFVAAKKAWVSIDSSLKLLLKESAKAAVFTIFDMEPLITERKKDTLTLKIQTDNEGKIGDVRDILIARNDIKWQIGLSIKHNHFAVKHSRLAKNLDFGKRWFNVECSSNYWEDIKPIFDYLQEQKNTNKKWNELLSKDTLVYLPLLKAFMDEIHRSSIIDSSISKKWLNIY
jgi:hypothetical protein